MKIEYVNKFRDVLLFNVAHQFSTPLLQIIFILLSLSIGWTPHNLAHTAMWSIFTYSSIWILQALFTGLLLYSRQNHTMLTKHVLILQEDGLIEETAFNRSLFFWKGGIHKVVVRANRVAIYISPFTAHVIPPHAFSSRTQMKDFIATVRSRRKPVG